MSETVSAKDYMTRDVITFTADMDIHLAIKVLVDKAISGAPVVDGSGNIVGILSTRDCLKVAFATSYHKDHGGWVSGLYEPRRGDHRRRHRYGRGRGPVSQVALSQVSRNQQQSPWSD